MNAPQEDTSKCAACGKEGGGLKSCSACKLVKYCNMTCQKAHRPNHKKECKKRAAEIHDEALFKDHPPNEECPICILPLSHDSMEWIHKTCCGKVLCNGCIVGVSEQSAMQLNMELDICPFCRKHKPNGDRDRIDRLRKRMECNDGFAFNTMGNAYEKGSNGLPIDMEKSTEMYQKAGEFGCTMGYFNLANSYKHGRGISADLKKSTQYYERAAMGGDVTARYNLGGIECRAKNYDRAIKHHMIGARAGGIECLDAVREWYEDKDITKDEYAKTLRAYQKSCDEMKSEQRDRANHMTEMCQMMGLENAY